MNDALLAVRGDFSGSNVYQKNWTQEWLDAHPYKSPTLDGGLANNQDDQGIAARLYSLCLSVLQRLCRQEHHISSSVHSHSTLKEELGKLYLWGEAFGDSKLDRALEYSDEVRSDVLESLGGIGRLLLREIWSSSGSVLEPPSSQGPIQELKYLVEQTRAITCSKNSYAAGNAEAEDGGFDTDQDDNSEDDETGEISEELGLHVRWLTQLGPTLEQNLIHADNARFRNLCPTVVPFSVSGPAAIYVSLVGEKYRQADNHLVERLGEANWQRHLGVRNGMETSIDVHEEPLHPAEDLAIPKSVFRLHSTFYDSGIGTSVPAQTQYPPSHMSLQSSNTEGRRESLRVPPTPAEVHENKPFQCFLCRSILSNLKNRDDWKFHIFSDLRPYICTFADCDDELAQFPSRAAWAEHEFSKHRTTRSWTCPECPQDFSQTSNWENHLREDHRLFFSGPNLQVAKDMAVKTEARRIENDECPLCRIVVGKPRRGFVKHVGRHMEEIALMALPRNVEEDSDEGSLSTDHASIEHSSSRLISQHDLAGAYIMNGQIGEAIELLEHVVKIEKEKLAEDHPSRLASQHELARAYEKKGQIDNAIELLEHVVKIEKEKLAEDHPSRLTSQHNLARAYRANGQVKKAVELLEHVVKVREKLAEDHPSRLASQHELARAYRVNGQMNKTIELFEHIVKIEKEKLVEDYPDRLTSQHELANAYLTNGQIDDTIELLEHVVRIEKEKLAENHPSRLVSQHNLALAYRAKGQYNEAIELLEHIVKIRKEKLAEDHPDRFVSEKALADAYQAREEAMGAENRST